MLQNLMAIGLGFLAAAFIGLLLAPPIWRRAVKKTAEDVRTRSPLTMNEIQADRDQLRAQYAAKARKLEIKTQQLNDKTAHQALQLSTLTEESRKFKALAEKQNEKINEKDEEITSLEEHTTSLKENFQAVQSNLKTKDKTIAKQERTLNRQARKLGRKQDFDLDTPTRAQSVEKIVKQEPKVEINIVPADDSDDELGKMMDVISNLVVKISDINAQKVKFDNQRLELQNTGLDENDKNSRARALEVERARLLTNLKDLEQRAHQAGVQLGELKQNWQGAFEPLEDVGAQIEILSGQMAAMTGQLAPDIMVETVPVEIDQIEGNPVGISLVEDEVETDDDAEATPIPTIAGRMSALQNNKIDTPE